jgi:hypothetical protein
MSYMISKDFIDKLPFPTVPLASNFNDADQDLLGKEGNGDKDESAVGTPVASATVGTLSGRMGPNDDQQVVHIRHIAETNGLQ